MITNGSKVKLNYVGRFENGEVFDSSEGKDPIEFIVGKGEVIPGFENGVLGLNVGESKSIEIEPENAYGVKRDDLIIEVNRDQVPEEVEVGIQLQGVSADGRPFNVTVSEIKENTVLLDGNHPLSGRKLLFDVEVVEVN
jgi:FKBP-type peptidyl-prolyl cis-trans isomerase 2